MGAATHVHSHALTRPSCPLLHGVLLAPSPLPGSSPPPGAMPAPLRLTRTSPIPTFPTSPGSTLLPSAGTTRCSAETLAILYVLSHIPLTLMTESLLPGSRVRRVVLHVGPRHPSHCASHRPPPLLLCRPGICRIRLLCQPRIGSGTPSCTPTVSLLRSRHRARWTR